MIQINNFFNNPNIKITEKSGPFAVLEYVGDLSNSPYDAQNAYFMQKMNIRKRQVVCYLDSSSIKLQAGAMQWMAGAVEMQSGIKNVGGFLGNLVKGAVTGESAVKPVYSGTGYVVTEPTFRYLIAEDVASWGNGVVIDDGLFLAAEASVQEKIVSRTNVSSALLGGEGLFNLCLSGKGSVVLETPVPREELIEVVLQNDMMKIDGNMAIAWSKDLEFTVEKAAKSLIGSGLSGEGFVNVYRGTGKILMAPVMSGSVFPNGNGPEQKSVSSSHGLAKTLKNSIEL